MRRNEEDTTAVEIPRTIIWLITGRCNLNCIHCYASRFSNISELPLAEKLRLIKEAHELGVHHISLTGGEVMILDELENILSTIKDHELSVSMVTNGILINEKKLRVIERYEVYLILSIDGAKKSTHEKIRGPGTWESVLRTLDLLDKEGLEFSTIMTISKINYHEVKDYIALAYEKGALAANLIPVMPSGRAGPDIIPESGEVVEAINEASEIADELKYPVNIWCTPFASLVTDSNYVRGWGCRTLSVVDIDPAGRLLLCDVLDFVLANFRGRSLLEALSIYQANPLLQKIVTPCLEGPCNACPLKWRCRGGCFARAYLILGDIERPDPLCPKVST